MPYTVPNPLEPGSAGHQPAFELSWELFGELCRVLALRVARDYDPEVVVGIATAGVLPAAVVASILQVDFFSIKISRREQGERVHDYPRLMSGAPPQVRGRRVLVVDEITTSGDTLRLALAAVRENDPADVRTATSFVKPGGYRPDYHALETGSLIVFPWDRQVVSDDGELVVHPAYTHAIDA
ncbi:MAG TPA: phosphoribosyltransferase family protein [Longimicrobiaceae bacterium]